MEYHQGIDPATRLDATCMHFIACEPLASGACCATSQSASGVPYAGANSADFQLSLGSWAMASSHVEVDIIILDWNRPDDTIAAVGSALSQVGVTRKIWVVDQGSRPDNRAKLAAYVEGKPDVHVQWLEHNVGVPAGRNVATRLGNAPFVVALDNDGLFTDPECVARAVQRLSTQPKLGAVAFRILDADTRSEAPYWDYPDVYVDSDIDSFEVTRFCGGGYALRREAFERAGFYDESLFFGGEERDVAWRMIKLGYTLRWFRDLAVLHRSTPEAKVKWTGRRYYFTVRNTLYINHKFGAGLTGLLRGGASFTLRGIRNGLVLAALRGVLAGYWMSLRFSLSSVDKHNYRLTPELRRYIADTDHKTNESWRTKLRRQLTPLPKV